MRVEEFLLIRLTVPAGHRPSAPPDQHPAILETCRDATP